MSSPEKVFKDNEFPQCEAADLNSYLNEINNAIKGAGLQLTPADLAQLREATIVQGLSATLHSVSPTGTKNNIILQPKGNKKTASEYYDGMRLLFFVENSNDSAVTIQLEALPQKDLKMPNGDEIEADVLKGYVEVVFDQVNDRFLLALQSGGGGSQGPGSNRLFYPSDQLLKKDYELAGDKNWMMAGPLIVDATAKLTVLPGARLAVV